MKCLFKQLKVIDADSKWNGKRVDILIDKGQVQDIKSNIPNAKHKLVKFDGACISPGWLDIGTQIGEPGLEHRETLNSATEAAKRGGFTTIAAFPNTEPALHSKSEIQFICNYSRENIVDILPIGAISRNCEGKDLTEMIDMHHSGAIAFSDGRNAVENAGLFLRALEYSKSTGKAIIHHPELPTLHPHGLMHEGKSSTQLGTVGIPSLSEELCLHRDIRLNEYAGAKLISHLLSTKEAVDMVRKQLKSGSIQGATVGYLHLLKEDKALDQFDIMYKILPPLREAKDRRALVRGVKDGTIKAICSHHEPIEEEAKDLEFSYSDFGATGLETCFAALLTELSDDLDISSITSVLSSGPRSLLGLSPIIIEKGSIANFTIFDPTRTWKYERSVSKSKNSPFLGMELRGAVLGIYNKRQYWSNPQFN